MNNENGSKWYIYEDDIHGSNALMSFSTKADLLDYIRSEAFVQESQLSQQINEGAYQRIRSYCEQFSKNEINHVEFSGRLLETLSQHGSGVASIYIEDFENLKTGDSEFSKFAIAGFCELTDVEPVGFIGDELSADYQDFFDRAYEFHWVG